MFKEELKKYVETSNLVNMKPAGAVVHKATWMNFYYDIQVFRQPDLTKKLMLERYGVVHWHKVDLDNIRITFTEEKKMTYWLLKWS